MAFRDNKFVPAWRLLAACAFGFQLAFLQAQEHGPVGAFKSSFDWQWKEGRATFFGDGDWPIHIGGCDYDYLWKDEGTGWDVVALADVHPEYVGSCGGCWEVRCKNGWTKDYSGKNYDRSNSCYDESASVIVRSVDTCKCYYPPNLESNKRWCCGDMDHLDLSKWAFEKLAELRWGVIKLEYRAVPCDYRPKKQAWINNPSEGNPKSPPYDAKRRTRDWPELRSKDIVPRVIFNDGWIQNEFKDVSWSAWMQPLEQTKQKGMLGGPGMCASVNGGGAFALKAWNGVFEKTVALEFWTYVGETDYHGSGNQPDIEVSISGDKGGCKPVRVMSLKPIMFQPTCRSFNCREEWWGYRIYLPAFAGSPPNTVLNDPQWFHGCGGNGVWDLNTVEFRHLPWDLDATPYFCLDRVHLV